MFINRFRCATFVVLFACFSPSFASAQGLLGGLIGDGDSGAVVTIDPGSAGSSGLLNVGIGGGEGNVLDANIGTSSTGTLVDANVSAGGGNGLLDVDIDINLGLGGGSNGSTVMNGTNGANGTNGVNGASGKTVIFANSGGGASGTATGSGSNACAGTNPNQLIALFQQTSLRDWNRAGNIQIVPIRVCAEMRRQVGNWLAGNNGYRAMVGAVAADSLISTALSRTKYQPGHVLGVQRQGATLIVYVF